ncbi:MAG: hypothetical protein EOO50_09785 [Flavobacterium sp.]|uniref:hypothetical protein n=1 Tax=Flavobacterium sp. TaxID=239 RepID=UPI001206EB39|nr:hypothetical protein [Flavobacterium sp.]RZJ66419.1 MAG: hypothetical protein EOO50_09785 [Flavobacterium sp.]
MIVIVAKYLIPKGFLGFTVYPFVLVASGKHKTDDVLINHERIHLRQQSELLVLPFFVWYFLEFLVRVIRYRDRKKAYFNISFEREAYANETDFGYLESRSLWRFLKYL